MKRRHFLKQAAQAGIGSGGWAVRSHPRVRDASGLAVDGWDSPTERQDWRGDCL